MNNKKRGAIFVFLIVNKVFRTLLNREKFLIFLVVLIILSSFLVSARQTNMLNWQGEFYGCGLSSEEETYLGGKIDGGVKNIDGGWNLDASLTELNIAFPSPNGNCFNIDGSDYYCGINSDDLTKNKWKNAAIYPGVYIDSLKSNTLFKNLIENGGFEAGPDGGKPDGWGSGIKSDEQSQDGTYSIKIADGNAGAYTDFMAASPNKADTLSSFINTNDLSNGNAFVVVQQFTTEDPDDLIPIEQDENGNWVRDENPSLTKSENKYHFSTFSQGTGGGWESYSKTFKTTDQTAFIKVGVTIWASTKDGAPPAQGSAYFDNVKLISYPINLIQNGAFEDGISQWTKHGTGGGSVVNGRYKIEDDSGDNNYLTQEITLAPGTYTLSADIQTDNVVYLGDYNYGSGIGVYDKKDVLEWNWEWSRPALTGTNSEKRISKSFTVTEEALIVVYLIQGNAGDATGTTWFDNVQLQAGSVSTPYEEYIAPADISSEACCPSTYCWDGSQCVESGLDSATLDEYYCLSGDWRTKEEIDNSEDYCKTGLGFKFRDGDFERQCCGLYGDKDDGFVYDGWLCRDNAGTWEWTNADIDSGKCEKTLKAFGQDWSAGSPYTSHSEANKCCGNIFSDYGSVVDYYLCMQEVAVPNNWYKAQDNMGLIKTIKQLGYQEAFNNIYAPGCENYFEYIDKGITIETCENEKIVLTTNGNDGLEVELRNINFGDADTTYGVVQIKTDNGGYNNQNRHNGITLKWKTGGAWQSAVAATKYDETLQILTFPSLIGEITGLKLHFAVKGTYEIDWVNITRTPFDAVSDGDKWYACDKNDDYIDWKEDDNDGTDEFIAVLGSGIIGANEEGGYETSGTGYLFGDHRGSGSSQRFCAKEDFNINSGACDIAGDAGLPPLATSKPKESFLCYNYLGTNEIAECCGSSLCFNYNKGAVAGVALPVLDDFDFTNSDGLIDRVFVTTFTGDERNDGNDQYFAIPKKHLNFHKWSDFSNGMLEFNLYSTDIGESDNFDVTLTAKVGGTNTLYTATNIMQYSHNSRRKDKWHHIKIPLSEFKNGDVPITSDALAEVTKIYIKASPDKTSEFTLAFDNFYLTGSETVYFCNDDRWLTTLSKKKACENQGYEWTGTKCCGAGYNPLTTSYDYYADGYEFGGGGCWNNSFVGYDQRVGDVFDDKDLNNVLYYKEADEPNAKFYGCKDDLSDTPFPVNEIEYCGHVSNSYYCDVNGYWNNKLRVDGNPNDEYTGSTLNMRGRDVVKDSDGDHLLNKLTNGGFDSGIGSGWAFTSGEGEVIDGKLKLDLNYAEIALKQPVTLEDSKEYTLSLDIDTTNLNDDGTCYIAAYKVSDNSILGDGIEIKKIDGKANKHYTFTTPVFTTKTDNAYVEIKCDISSFNTVYFDNVQLEKSPAKSPYIEDRSNLNGCCPALLCWDGNKCVPQGRDIFKDFPFENAPSTNYKCFAGSWQPSYKKEKYDTPDDFGYCSENQCWAGAVDKCVDTGFPVDKDDPPDGTIDYICKNGDWKTRTSLVALQLLNITHDSNSNNYTLYCDDYTNALNFYDETYFVSGGTKYVNEVCVLRLRKLDGSEQVIFGTSLNRKINATPNPFINVLTGVTNCNNAISNPTEGKFKQCVTANSQAWYDQGNKMIIYSNTPILNYAGQFDISGWDKLLTFLRDAPNRLTNFINNLFKDVTKGAGWDEDQEFINSIKESSAIYIARKGDRSIHGVVKENKIFVTYTGFTEDICTTINAEHPNFCKSGGMNIYNVQYDLNVNTAGLWKELTVRLRPQTHEETCSSEGGYWDGAYCWYIGSTDKNCQQTCSAHGVSAGCVRDAPDCAVCRHLVDDPTASCTGSDWEGQPSYHPDSNGCAYQTDCSNWDEMESGSMNQRICACNTNS